MTKTLRLLSCILIGIVFGLTACARTEMTAPSAMDVPTFMEISSLQPALQWDPIREAGATYDLAVWEAGGRVIPIPEREVYYKEGLTSHHHTIDTPLQPNVRYVLSVRTRRNQSLSKWSTPIYVLIKPGLISKSQEKDTR